MKKFENKVISIEGREGKPMSYSDLIKECINVIPKDLAREGWTPSLQKESFRVEDAMSKAKPNKTFDIEDSDVNLIKKFCSDFPWAMRNKDLVEFDEYIKSL